MSEQKAAMGGNGGGTGTGGLSSVPFPTPEGQCVAVSAGQDAARVWLQRESLGE